MVCATELTSHDNCHSVVSNVSDFSLIVKLLVKDAVFDVHPNKGSNKSEFTNLFFYETITIAVEGLLAFYQYKGHRNWKLRVSLDGRLPDIEVGKESDINVIERADLFNNSKTNNDSNNNR